jgi:SdpC family antimicrobial peptide
MIITFIRKHLMNAYTSIPMLVCLLFATWSSYGKRPVSSVNFSGEEMFRGLFFVEGKYAEAIPELKSMGISYMYNDMSKEEKTNLDQLRNEVVSLIKADDIEFFEDFKSIMLSENPTMIKEELAKAHDFVNSKIQEVLKINKAEFDKIQHEFKESVTQNHNKIDHKFLEKFGKGSASSKIENQPCIILLLPICIVLYCEPIVIVYVIALEESVASKKSALFLEQVVASVCDVSAQINA